MRSYGGNKSYGDRRSFPYASEPFRPRPLASLLAVGGFYWLSIIIYALLSVTSSAESAKFVDHPPGEDDQRRMRSNGFGWKRMSDGIPASATVLTPDTYPLPSDQGRCAHSSEELASLCTKSSARSRHDQEGEPNDAPYSGLDTNDASKIVRSDHSVHESPGHRHSATCIQRRFYTVGIALAKTMQDDGLGQCNGNGGVEKRYNLDSERALKSLLEKAKVLPKMARKLRLTKWSNRDTECSTDILILIVQSVAFCHEGSKAVFFGMEPLMGLSFSPRVKRLLAESTAANLEQSRRRWKTDPPNPDVIAHEHPIRKHSYSRPVPTNCHNMNCVINMIRRIMQVLDDGLPVVPDREYKKEELDDTEQASSEQDDHPIRPPADPSEIPQWFAPKHTVPGWALIAFAVSLGVTLGCACLGHWVNTGRSRLHASSEAASAARYHSHHNRRWRAGFGGGMLELHSQQKGGGAGHGSSGGFGQPARARPGMPTGTTRAKMFGGLGGMGAAGARSRQMNGPQHSYHRV